jgi:hypothetical protein
LTPALSCPHWSEHPNTTTPAPASTLKQGCGFAHGNRLSAETLPALLLHAMHLIGSASDAMGDLNEKAIAALRERQSD